MSKGNGNASGKQHNLAPPPDLDPLNRVGVSSLLPVGGPLTAKEYRERIRTSGGSRGEPRPAMSRRDPHGEPGAAGRVWSLGVRLRLPGRDMGRGLAGPARPRLRGPPRVGICECRMRLPPASREPEARALYIASLAGRERPGPHGSAPDTERAASWPRVFGGQSAPAPHRMHVASDGLECGSDRWAPP